MLKKYIDFITESKEIEFILESDVMFSDNFKKILGKLNNPIAKKILELEKEDLPVTQNFFDIDTNRNNYLFFTPDRKAQEILNDPKEVVRFIGNGGGWLTNSDANDKLFTILGCPRGVYRPQSSEVGEVVAKHGPTAKGNIYVYVKFPGGEGVYNQDKLRQVDDKSKLVWSKNRQDVQVGRSMNALLNLAKQNDATINFTPRDLELFVNDYKAALDKFNDKFSFFDVVQGDQIHFYYDSDNYYDADYTLGGSCMAGARESMLSIYCDNDNVSLVIFRAPEDEERIVGRAILWKLLDGKFFMDRIYSNNDSDVNLFREYAKEEGWYSKRHNNSSSNNSVYDPSGNEIQIDLSCQLGRGHDEFPYLDTLKFYSPKTGIISYKKQDGINYFCEDTDGGFEDYCGTCEGEDTITCTECTGDGEIECPKCNGDASSTCTDCDGDGTSGEDTCETCGGDGEVHCDECSGDGKITCPKCDGDESIDCPDCNN
jgi:hypothetical protein